MIDRFGGLGYVDEAMETAIENREDDKFSARSQRAALAESASHLFDIGEYWLSGWSHQSRPRRSMRRESPESILLKRWNVITRKIEEASEEAASDVR